MHETTIKLVTRADIPHLDSALRALAGHLGDAYRSDQQTLAAALGAPNAHCLAILAMRGETPVGALLASLMFSTMRGGAGLYVSDLWVAETARGHGLARRLLANALSEGTARNADRFLKLAVYDDNPEARVVYDRLGFTHQPRETNMVLIGPALGNLKETT
ncbi:GNAT family N-acetyltransferase [Marivita sp. S2033]|uniref:GNAT family N-acetyltransferase n=1 Tax=Marivita sp. S2033 TaxID=3373187 RepID=UPI003982AD46